MLITRPKLRDARSSVDVRVALDKEPRPVDGRYNETVGKICFLLVTRFLLANVLLATLSQTDFLFHHIAEERKDGISFWCMPFGT